MILFTLEKLTVYMKSGGVRMRHYQIIINFIIKDYEDIKFFQEEPPTH